MPGSLLSPPRSRVARNESTRSDQSDSSNTSHSSTAANKKVSFSKAVRVKKYTKPKKVEDTTNGSEKRFWFKVYKNRHRQAPDPKEFRGNGVIHYDNRLGGEAICYDENGDVVTYHPNPSPLNYPILTNECGTQTPPKDYSRLSPDLHSSQKPTELPHVKKNHVKKIVNRFNDESLFHRHDMSPPGSPVPPPRYHSTPIKSSHRIPTPPPEPPISSSYSSRFKKSPIVNGVKVMFGMNPSKRDKTNVFETRNGNRSSPEDIDHMPGRYSPDHRTRISEKYPYRTEIRVSDGSDTEAKVPYDRQIVVRDYKPTYGEFTPTSPGGLFRRDEETNGNDFHDYQQDDRKGKYHVETFDSGNRLVMDTTDINTSSTKLDNGEMFTTVGEKHQVWQNNRRVIVYEEPSPKIIRRKAKSHTDLTHEDMGYRKDTVDKGISTEHLALRHKEDTLSKKAKDSWLKLWRTSTRDKGVQCDNVPTSETSGKFKIMRARNGVASAYSNVPSSTDYKQHSKIYRTESNLTEEYNPSVLSSTYKNGDIYSQVDKSRKKRSEKKTKGLFDNVRKNGSLFKSRSEPLYIGPPPKGIHPDDRYYIDDGDRTIKTSKRSFGFRLNAGSEDRDPFRHARPAYKEENWYDVDDDIDALRSPHHRDVAEVRHELADDEFVSDLSSSGENARNNAGSVIREVDYKKREISYENVPRSDGESKNHNNPGTSGLWFRDADEDYRKEMAQNDVSYPAGSHVGSDRFYTTSRSNKSSKQKPPPSPRAYTLDRRHFKEKKETPKILVNGEEISDKASFKKNKSRKFREDPSSVQSDPMYVRGGLAAAYQARQRSAVRRSNSTAAGIGTSYRTTSPVVRRRYRGTSEASGASSENETAHSRKPLIMYIPGISHQERPPVNGDRSSGINLARSQSMMTSTRPSRVISKKSSRKSGSKQDLYRNNNNVDFYEEDEISPLPSEMNNKKKPPKVPYESKKSVKRSQSMPKDTKFSWLKWRIRGKPSREP